MIKVRLNEDHIRCYWRNLGLSKIISLTSMFVGVQQDWKAGANVIKRGNLSK
jgi:hypothetical protein